MALVAAAAGEVGGYVSLAKIIVMLVLFSCWVYAAPWINKDSRSLQLGQTRWSIVILSGGTLGWVLWLTIPYFAIGMALYLVAAGGTVAYYVVFRNSRVPESSRVLTWEHLTSILGPRKGPLVDVVTRVKLYGHHGRIILAPNVHESKLGEIRAYNQAQGLLHDLVWYRASEGELVPGGHHVHLRLVIDGVVTDRRSMSLQDGEAVMQYLKLHGGMDVEDRRRPQRGRLTVDLGGKRVDITLISTGSTRGQRMQFRIEQEAVRTHLDELGMAPDQLARVREMMLGGNGLVIASGRSGSGVTSTLYSLIREHDAFTKVLVTLERTPKIDMENITQYAYGDDSKLPDMLASAIRRDPDVVMVDACPDSTTAAHIIEAAAAKSVCLGIHATDSFMALAKWLKVSGKPAAAMENLRGVLYQVLLRKLCPACKEAYRPEPRFLEKANLQSEDIDKFYRARTRPLTDEKGNPVICQTCQGTAYVGRTGAFELLEMTQSLKELVLAGASVREIKADCRKSKMLYLQERALQKVMFGDTSVQEVIRITQEKNK
jgi:general secretion pathway protein E